jgi:hypothetical protein
VPPCATQFISPHLDLLPHPHSPYPAPPCPEQVMYAEPLGARPAGGGDPIGSAFLPSSGGSEENVAAAAAAAAVAGMHHGFMSAASPQEATCSTSMQLHTPMTGGWVEWALVGAAAVLGELFPSCMLCTLCLLLRSPHTRAPSAQQNSSPCNGY